MKMRLPAIRRRRWSGSNAPRSQLPRTASKRTDGNAALRAVTSASPSPQWSTRVTSGCRRIASFRLDVLPCESETTRMCMPGTRDGFPPSRRRQNPFATRKSRGSSGGGSRRNTVGTAVTTTTTVPRYRSSQWRRSDEFSKQGDAVGFRGTREEGQHVGTEGGYVERGQLVEDGLMQVCRIRDANLGVKVRVVRCSLPQQPGDVVEVASHRTRPV